MKAIFMKQTRAIILAAGVAMAGLAFAAGGQEIRTDINPALLYYQAMILDVELPAADRDYLFQNEWRGQKLPDRLGKLINSYNARLRYLRNASRATVPCDWGIDFSPGPDTLLPHLARCKQMGNLADLRAQWELQNGDKAGARDDLLAAFALGRNTSRDNSLIGALVQFAVQNNVIETAARGFGLLDGATLEQLKVGFDAAPAAGTLANAYQNGERYCNYEWLERKILQWQKESGGDDAKVMTQANELFQNFSGDNGSNELVVALTRVKTSAALLEMVRGAEPFYAQATQLLTLPHPQFEEQAKTFEAALESSGNPLLKVVFPSLTKARQKEFRTEALLAMFNAAAAFKANGAPGFNAVADPFGQGPFQMNRFMYEGNDRGFQLTSAYAGYGYPETLIFLETDGPAINLFGPKAGQPLEMPANARGTTAK
jgi:hypothetical protein